jgi:uncharacterized membrane protein
MNGDGREGGGFPTSAGVLLGMGLGGFFVSTPSHTR